MLQLKNGAMEQVAHTKDMETELAMEITPFEAEMLAALMKAAEGPGYHDWAAFGHPLGHRTFDRSQICEKSD